MSIRSALTREQITARIEQLGPWFHNLDIAGVKTAPQHFLGDYPRQKWQRFAHALPEDMTGLSVLDIGCNAGFYSLEMRKRGASPVVGIDSDERYLEQARFVAQVSGFDDIELQQMSVYDLARLNRRFDVVLFMGVLYHLRYPLLALDLLHEHVVGDLLVFQSMQRGSEHIAPVPEDAPFEQEEQFARAGYPVLHFVEHRYAGDPTNWWIPNRACVEGMLRSAGFVILDHPEQEVYVCRIGSSHRR